MDTLEEEEAGGGHGLYPSPPSSSSSFRMMEKRFRLQAPPSRSRKRQPPRTLPPPCLSEALDFLHSHNHHQAPPTIIPVEGCDWTMEGLRVLGHKDNHDGLPPPKAYKLTDREGGQFDHLGLGLICTSSSSSGKFADEPVSLAPSFCLYCSRLMYPQRLGHLFLARHLPASPPSSSAQASISSPRP